MTLPLTELQPDHYFDPDRRATALALYETVRDLPLICPHGHVDPALFADPDARFPDPAELLVIPDHYVFRMLYSQGVSMEAMGIPRVDGGAVEEDPRRIWQVFADHYHLFQGTPTGMWLNQELVQIFGVPEKLSAASAQTIYDQLEDALTRPEFSPRALFERFNIEVLATTDPAQSTLEHHKALGVSDWQGRVIPTFRPDQVVNLDTLGWCGHINDLSAAAGIDITDYDSFIEALEKQRVLFKELGATATDHAALVPRVESLSRQGAAMIFDRALRQGGSVDDAPAFTAHMLMEMARMSTEDGLVMQLHPGSLRNHNRSIFENHGPDMGADIPIATEFTRNLQPLLNRFGSEPGFRLIVFMLDESTLSRELAPLAGHYPAMRLGPPWWFFDSWNGMMRFRELVSETCGLYNTAGFNDDTRAYPSIPIRHDLARRVDANWIAGLLERQVIDEEDAAQMMRAAAYGLAKDAYRLDDG